MKQEKQSRVKQVRHFSLVETMVAVTILLVLMVALIRIFSATQRVWTASGNLSSVYENAQVALGVVTRDLQSAVVREGTTLEKSIRFLQPSAQALSFVSVGTDSQLVEVAYKLEGRDFMRASRNDDDPDWNVYGDRNPMTESDTYETVTENVVGLGFTCYHADGTTWEVPSDATPETIAPAAISVTLTLVDNQTLRLLDRLPEEARSRLLAQKSRTISKTVCLGRRD
jgi:hypothetical protein